MESIQKVDVCVIGGGQAALACAYFLKKANLNFIILDNQVHSGGAWQHAWDSLELFSPSSWSSISGWMMPPTLHEYPSRLEVINYLTQYEARYKFPIVRPIKVLSVVAHGKELQVMTENRIWEAKAVISATGTWSNPYIPYYKGFEKFKGDSIHSAHYNCPDFFKNKKVLIVGGGNSGAQIVAEVSKVAETIWVTHTPPQFLPDEVDGRVLFLRATERLKAQQEGRTISEPIGGFGDIVMIDSVKNARDRGVLVSKPPFEYFTDNKIVWSSGESQEIDAVIWCTGFNPELSHLKSLNVIEENRRVLTIDSRSIKQPNLWLVGYGDWSGIASATLIGVSRTAKKAVSEISEYLSTNIKNT